MIMIVAVQQSESPWSAAKILMAYIRTAAETKLALRPDVVMWNQYLSYCVRYSGGSGSGDKCHPSTETVEKIENLLRQMESEGGVEAKVRSCTQHLRAWADSGLPESFRDGGAVEGHQVVVANIQNRAQCILLDNCHQGLGLQYFARSSHQDCVALAANEDRGLPSKCCHLYSRSVLLDRQLLARGACQGGGNTAENGGGRLHAQICDVFFTC
jgi:hypothetical protein